MKNYNKVTRNIKGFSLVKFLLIIATIILALDALSVHSERTSTQKFYALKDLTQKIADKVHNYYIINGAYPDAISQLNANLHIGYEGPNFLIGRHDNAWCLISKTYGQVTCTQKVLGGRLGFLVNVNDSSTKCISFNRNNNHFINRLCKKEFKDYNALFNCDEFLYALNRTIIIRNVGSEDCK